MSSCKLWDSGVDTQDSIFNDGMSDSTNEVMEMIHEIKRAPGIYLLRLDILTS